MLEELDQTLAAFLARTLEFDPALSRDDAVRRVAHIAEDAGMPGLEQRLGRLASALHERGVINPRWLFPSEVRPRFFLANGRVGFLDQVIQDVDRVGDGVSQYVVYGHWDSLLILYGSAEEAARLLTRLELGAYEELVSFHAQDVLLAYRHRTPSTWDPLENIAPEEVNNLALDYAAADKRDLRESLLGARIMLGPTLTLDGVSPYPLTAFVGITVRARGAITGREVLETLMRQDDLHHCLVHLFQIDQGFPFHYFAKIACASVGELDKATNAIAFASHGGIRFEGETLVVAHGSDRLPLVRKPDIASLAISPDISPIVRAAQRVFDYLEPPERLSFNALADERQLATLRALAGLRTVAEANEFDQPTATRIASAISTFARESTRPDGGPNLTGAVVEIASMVEVLAKTFLSKLAYSVFGNNPGVIQNELQLPTRVIKNLSLGKVVQALKVATASRHVIDAGHQLSDEWNDRLAGFADERNSWAHGAAQGTATQVIDQAFSAIREGIEISGWLASELEMLRAKQQVPHQATGDTDLKLLPRTPGADVSVFVSHASADAAVAERLAMGLQAVGYRSWYSQWELHPGDSIVERIEAALSASDVLVVVLSKKSVASGWVQRELNSVLIGQLSGAKVLVIPVLAEDCEIPRLLTDILYVDLRDDFETGFRALLDALRQHRAPDRLTSLPRTRTGS